MRITDPRWPAVREFARSMLRTEDLVIHGPSWLEPVVHQMNIRLSDVQPSRISFPAFQKGDENSISLHRNGEDVMLGKCCEDEPPSEVVWLPMEPETGWASIFSVATDLLDAGYPGCLGCGGPHTEGSWDELASRKNMAEFSNK